VFNVFKCIVFNVFKCNDLRLAHRTMRSGLRPASAAVHARIATFVSHPMNNTHGGLRPAGV